ncbi:MAG: BREX-4 system phosphatase PglZ, partial [Candidatus Methanomethyliaceae archaeon]
MRPSVISFTRTEDLITIMHEEATRITRFPVRLILVEGLNAWQELVEQLRWDVDEVLCLSSLCTGKDIYPSAQLVESSIEEYLRRDTVRKILVLPWGEWLRLELYPKQDRQEECSQSIAFNLLIKLVQKEKVGKKRIYIPLFEIAETVEKLQEQILRYAGGEIPPVWRITGRGFVRVIAVPFAPGKARVPLVFGVQDYLKRWEQGGAAELILVTQWTPWLNGRKANFTLEVCRHAYQVLTNMIESWPTSIAEEWGREEDWRWLAQNCRQGETFDELATRLLEVKQYQSERLFGWWRDFSPEKQWLVWLWSKLEFAGSGYVKRVLERSTDAEQFKKLLIYHVLEGMPSTAEVYERKQLLLTMGQKELPAAFLEAVAELPDPLHRL